MILETGPADQET